MIQTLIRYKSLSVNQLLSDLNWALTSQSLIQSNMPEFEGDIVNTIQSWVNTEEYTTWFKNIKRNPTKLIGFFNNEEQLILGKYLERLLNFFFTEYSSIELIHAGKQIFEKQITKGELDFVIENVNENEVFHLEVAVKYYMGFKNVAKHDLWIGPNGMDTLQKKMLKLDLQLKLSKELDIHIDDNKALILGYFFKHWNSANWPYFYTEREGQGQWLYEDEMQQFFKEDKFYSIVPKYRWLSFFLEGQSLLKNGREIQKEISNQIKTIGKGIMVVEVDASKKILNKCIVAPINWPRL